MRFSRGWKVLTELKLILSFATVAAAASHCRALFFRRFVGNMMWCCKMHSGPGFINDRALSLAFARAHTRDARSFRVAIRAIVSLIHARCNTNRGIMEEWRRRSRCQPLYHFIINARQKGFMRRPSLLVTGFSSKWRVTASARDARSVVTFSPLPPLSPLFCFTNTSRRYFFVHV